MGVNAAISVDEYLHTSFPGLDREYWDGELMERSLPDYLHGKVQALLCAFFGALGRRRKLHPCVETRMKLGPNRFLIPDVAVFYPAEPERVPETPPLIVVEVLSLDDKLAAVRDKLEQYRDWGVPNIWLADPHSKRFYRYEKGLIETASLEVPELEIAVRHEDVFD